MPRPIAYAIDLGATTTVLAVALRDRVDVVVPQPPPGATHTGGAGIPTAAYVHREMLPLAGGDPFQRHLADGGARTGCASCDRVEMVGRRARTECMHYRPGHGCHDSRLIPALKMLLTDPRDCVHLWGQDLEITDLTALVLRELKATADARYGTVNRGVIGRPPFFPGGDGVDVAAEQARAVARLTKAGKLAGFDELELVDEPVAVVTGERGPGTVLAIDFGGSTFDVALVAVEEFDAEILALQGGAIGGGDFDAAIFERVVAPAMGLDDPLPDAVTDAMRSRRQITAAISNQDLAAELRFLSERGRAGVDRVLSLLQADAAIHLYSAIERAKIALSSGDEAHIWFPQPGTAGTLDVVLERGEFEQLIKLDLEQVFGQIEDTLHQARVSPGAVDLVILTGGSSQIPAFRRRLAEMFTADRIALRDPFTTVVRGLALRARQVWA